MFIQTVPQTLFPNICSQQFQIQSKFGGRSRPFPGLVADLTAPSGITFYSDSACTNAITSVTFAGSGTTFVAYAKANSALGSVEFQVSATNHIATKQTQNVIDNPATWRGTVSNLWNNPNNWAGNIVPSTTHTVQFDGSCVTFCAPSMPANVNVAGVRVFSSFTGSINQTNGSSLTVGAGGWIQEGGTFNGSTAGDAITFTGGGPFKIAGGAFRATTGTFSTNVTIFEISGSGSINAAGGSIILTGPTNIALSPGSSTYNNFAFVGSNTNVSLNGTLKIGSTGTLRFDSTSFPSFVNGGDIECAGNVVVNNLGFRTTTTATTLTLNGTGSKTIDASSTSAGAVPQLVVNAGGTVTAMGTIDIWGGLSVLGGTFNPGSATFNLYGPNANYPLRPGSGTYANVYFKGNNSQSYDLNGDTWKVSGLISFGGTNAASPPNLNNGTIEVSGNIEIQSAGVRGTALVRLMGSGPSSINGLGASAGATIPQMPALEIASSGNVTLQGNILAHGNYTYTSGNIISGTSTLGTLSSGAFKGGSATYYNVLIGTPGFANHLIDGNLSVSNNLTLGISGASNTFNQRNPGGAYAVTVGGILRLPSATHTYNRFGSALSYGSFSGAGVVNP